jgi:hypothetical protein
MAVKGAPQSVIDESIQEIEKRWRREDAEGESARVKAEGKAIGGLSPPEAPEGSEASQSEASNDDFALPTKTQNNFCNCDSCQ